MGEVGDAGVAHRRRHPFHRVHGADQPAHRRQAGGVPLPLEQQRVAGAQVLPTLCQEQLGVLRQVHAQPSTRCTASSTREGWNGFTTKSFAPAWIASTTRACCPMALRSEEHTSELQSQSNLVCRLLLEKKNDNPR